MQGLTATTRHGVRRKETQKTFQDTDSERNQKRKFKSPVVSLYRTRDKDKDDLVDSNFDKAETLANQFASAFSKESDSEWD